MKRILSSLNGRLSTDNNNQNIKFNKNTNINNKVKLRDENKVSRDKKKSDEFLLKLKSTVREGSIKKVIVIYIKIKEIGKFDVKNIIQESNNELPMDFSSNNKVIEKKEYYNKLSIERINFKFEEYQMYPEINFRPSIFFLKFLCIKPELRKECNNIFLFFSKFFYNFKNFYNKK